MSGGRFEFDDGGIYCGEWLDGKAHSFGVCTGPNNEGRFEGFWQNGLEISGTYSWSDKHVYSGGWRDGKINGLGVEDSPNWTYFGEWKDGLRHGSGVLLNRKTNSRYEGTWVNGLQEGYGREISFNGAYYTGQWKKGLRHGYGMKVTANVAKVNRKSQHMSFLQPYESQAACNKRKATFRVSSNLQASYESSFENYETDRSFSPNPKLKRTYFSLHGKSDRSRSVGSRSDSNEITDNIANEFSPSHLNSQPSKSPVGEESVRTDMTSHSSGFGTMSESSSSNSLNLAVNATPLEESYKGEWVSDRRNSYGISEYIDGSRYVGSWKKDERDGYGALFHGNIEASGKWRNDELLSTLPKKGISLRSPRMRTKVRISLDAATEAARLAAEKCKTVLSRSATARKIAESAKMAANKATEHASIARSRAEQFDIQLSDSHLDMVMSPRDRFIGEPTLMAFEISENLPPRLEPSNANGHTNPSKHSAHPAKLAGLFAAMDLSLSAGAVSPMISNALHSRDRQGKLTRVRKTRPVSLNSAQDAWSKLSSSISTFKPGFIGASILLPGFPLRSSMELEKKEAEQEPYYYSSAKELEMKNQKGNSSVAGNTDSASTSKSTLVCSQTETESPSVSHCRSFSQSATTVSQHSCSLSQVSGTASDISSLASQASGKISWGSRTISQSSVSSSVVKISGITSMGDQIKFGYMQARANVDGNYKPIYCTKAPRPRLNHNTSISESKSVSAATGLYRTIVGELPPVLLLHEEYDTEVNRPRDDVATEDKNKAVKETASSSSCEEKPNDVIGKLNSADEFDIDRSIEEVIRRRSLEKLRADENDVNVDLAKSNRQFINHSRTHPSVFRTSSKIRRQKQVDDNDGELVEDRTETRSLHERVRKTKSDVSNVRIMNSRRTQIPVRTAKSFDMDALEKDDTEIMKSSKDESRKRVVVCLKDIKVDYPRSAKYRASLYDDLMNNNVNNHSSIEKPRIGKRFSSEEYQSDGSVFEDSPSPFSSFVRNSWYSDGSLSRDIHKRAPVYVYNGVDLKDVTGNRQIRRGHFSRTPTQEAIEDPLFSFFLN